MYEALVAFSSGQVQQPVREMLPVEAERRYFASMATLQRV